jgi:hypothetical protein
MIVAVQPTTNSTQQVQGTELHGQQEPHGGILQMKTYSYILPFMP